MKRRQRSHPLAWLTVIALLVVATLIVRGDPGDPALYPVKPGAPAVEAYVAADSFHSSLTVPTAALLANPGPTAEAVRRLIPQPWTTLGWGDAKFYQHQGWSLARRLDLIRSLVWPFNRSTVHVAGLDDPLVDAKHPDILRLRLSPAGFRALERRVDASFVLRDDHPVFDKRGLGTNDLFFQGRGHANVLAECNQWTSGLLHAAGVPTSRALATIAPGLALDLQLRAHAERAPSRSPQARPPARSRP